MPGCPTCGAELTYLEPYARYYCPSCRSYAPEEIVPCDTCDRLLVFVPEHGTFYCHGCQEYKEGARQATHPCPRCGQELFYLAEHGRFFCHRCNEFAPEDRPSREKDGRRETLTKAKGSVTGFAPFSREEMDLASKDQLIRWCKEYALDESGMKYELRLRLLEYIRRQGLLLKGEDPLEEEVAAPPEGVAAAPTPPPESTTDAGDTAQAVVELPVTPAPTESQGACPSCGGGLSYVPQYHRWYCYNCDTYAPADGAAPAPRVGAAQVTARAVGSPRAGIALTVAGLLTFLAHQVLFIAPALFPIPVYVTGAEIAFALPLLGFVLLAVGVIAGFMGLRPHE
ncbi:MAG: hypothetical protein ACE5LS_03385 [Thermoplasmata archaeon]